MCKHTMSIVLIPDAPKAMAFGGVATGSINAYEQQTAAGSIRYRGFTQIPMALKQLIPNFKNVEIFKMLFG